MVPGLKGTQYVYEDILKELASQGCRWVDLGCGHNILPDWRKEEEKKIAEVPELLVGTDYDTESLKKHRTISNLVRTNLEDLPFKSNSFDLATSNMVFEHLKNPDKVFNEIHRILRPHGKLLIHTPNRYGYISIMSAIIPEKIKGLIIKILEGRTSEDIFPTYYRVNNINQILSLAKNNDFTIEEIKMINAGSRFAIIIPIAILELFLIRILTFKKFEKFRNNIIAIFTKDVVCKYL